MQHIVGLHVVAVMLSVIVDRLIVIDDCCCWLLLQLLGQLKILLGNLVEFLLRCLLSCLLSGILYVQFARLEMSTIALLVS